MAWEGGGGGIKYLWRNSPTPQPPYRATSTPQPKFHIQNENQATNTPLGPSLRAGPTPTPQYYYRSSDNPDLRIIIEVDWAEVDIPEAIIDVVGIGGDTALFFQPEGTVVNIITDAIEGVSFVHATSEMLAGDPSSMLLDQANSAGERTLLTIFKGERIIPGFGIIGNLISLYFNFRNNINVNINYR